MAEDFPSETDRRPGGQGSEEESGHLLNSAAPVLYQQRPSPVVGLITQVWGTNTFRPYENRGLEEILEQLPWRRRQQRERMPYFSIYWTTTVRTDNWGSVDSKLAPLHDQYRSILFLPVLSTRLVSVDLPLSHGRWISTRPPRRLFSPPTFYWSSSLLSIAYSHILRCFASEKLNFSLYGSRSSVLSVFFNLEAFFNFHTTNSLWRVFK